ncbi:AAA family ATPase [Roseivirga sp. BDSF3-8]|uniref:AAA family ATPase n=1 Tax=Roseivirga sp. BDSF3-8 TaxID=3241598 RepID=UPI0035318D22
MIKVVITGPESSGKTTLASSLAHHYQVPLVPEYSRQYLSRISGPYTEEDLLVIAKGQVFNEKQKASLCPGLLICDTDITVISIWSLEKFRRIAPSLADLEVSTTYHLTFLCRPDIPWEPDPLRENPHDRDRLFILYKQRLKELRRPFTILEGSEAERLHTALNIIDNLI